MNWSGGFQYQISDSWLTEVLYQGSAGVGLLNNWDINVRAAEYLDRSARN